MSIFPDLKESLFIWKDLLDEKEKIDEICANLFYFYRSGDCSYINHFRIKYPKTYNLYTKQLLYFNKQKEVNKMDWWGENEPIGIGGEEEEEKE